MKSKTNKYEIIKNIIIFALAWITLLGILVNYQQDIQKIYFNGNNFMYLLAICGIYVLYKKAIQIKGKRIRGVSGTFSIILSAIYCISYLTANYFLDNTLQFQGKFVLFITIKFISIVLLFMAVILIAYQYIDNRYKQEYNVKKEEPEFFSANKKSFFMVIGIFMIVFLPFLINSYPGNLTWDFIVQIKQALGYEQLQNHHPYIHTIIIGLCMNFGYALTKNYNIAIFIYTLLQYMLSCITLSFIIYYMAKKKISIAYRLITLLFFLVLPIFSMYTVWLTKDILFALTIVWITIGMIEISTNPDSLKSKKMIIYMIISLFTSMIFRKNGMYIAVLLAFVTIIMNRKYWKQVCIIFVTSIALFAIIDGPVRKAMNIENGSVVEMLSIPAQQMARIYKYEYETLSQEQKEKIEYYFDDNIGELYDPLVSDPVKEKFNLEHLKESKVEFIKLSFELAIKYLGRTLESFTCTTYQFYYLDNNVLRGMDEYKLQSTSLINDVEGMVPDDMNIYNNKFEINWVNWLNEKMHQKDIPILSTLCSSGIYIAILLVSIGYVIYRKNSRLILAFLPVFLVLLTQLAGPVVDQRYTYSIFLCTSLLMVLPIELINKNQESDERK